MALHLIVSSLFGAMAAKQTRYALEHCETYRLEHVLSRAKYNAVADRQDYLLALLFDLHEEPLPVAPLTWLADSGRFADHYCLRADPVHLKADRDRVVLCRSHDLVITNDEAQAMVADINAQLGEPGWRLEAPCAHRWYLHLDRPAEMNTHAPDLALAQDCFHFQPSGPDAADWRRRINEIQMLMHGSAVNAVRRENGFEDINSLWLWGGGMMPTLKSRRWHSVMARDPLTKGLALASSNPLFDLPATLEACLELVDLTGQKQGLVVLEPCDESLAFGDINAWYDWYVSVNRNWIEPLAQALKERRLDTVHLYPGNGRCYTLDRQALRRWWRRRRTLARIL